MHRNTSWRDGNQRDRTEETTVLYVLYLPDLLETWRFKLRMELRAEYVICGGYYKKE
jgi:hypothetical protein